MNAAALTEEDLQYKKVNTNPGPPKTISSTISPSTACQSLFL